MDRAGSSGQSRSIQLYYLLGFPKKHSLQVFWFGNPSDWLLHAAMNEPVQFSAALLAFSQTACRVGTRPVLSYPAVGWGLGVFWDMAGDKLLCRSKRWEVWTSEDKYGNG